MLGDFLAYFFGMSRKLACSGKIFINVPEECRTGPGFLSRKVPLPFSPPAAYFPVINLLTSFFSVKFKLLYYLMNFLQ